MDTYDNTKNAHFLQQQEPHSQIFEFMSYDNQDIYQQYNESEPIDEMDQDSDAIIQLITDALPAQSSSLTLSQKGSKCDFIVTSNPRCYNIATHVSFLLHDDIIINQYLYHRGSQYDIVDATCCPLMQFRPIVKVEKQKYACIGFLDTSHPHQEDVSQASDMLLNLQSSFAKRTFEALQGFNHQLKNKRFLREEIDAFTRDRLFLSSRVHKAHLKSLMIFQQMLETSSKDAYFFFHYKRFDVSTLSHKLHSVGHNANLSELFGGDNDQNVANLYMKKKGLPTYLDARGFLNFSLALFEKRDRFESSFVTFDGFIVPMAGKYTCYQLSQAEIISNKYYDGDLVEFMEFTINPNIVKHIRRSRRKTNALSLAIDNFEHDMKSEIFLQKFYPQKFDELTKPNQITAPSSSSIDFHL